MKTKKIISFILVICMVISLMPAGILKVSAGTQTSGTTGDCTWTLDGTVLTISGNGEMGDYTVPNPAPWGKSVTKVIINDGVTNIGQVAFNDCSSLTSITIPDSVISIENHAFRGCSSLKSITIPYNVTSIGTWTFSKCSNLTDIIVSSKNNYYSSLNGVLFIKDKTELICYPGGKSATSYVIPDTVTSVGEYAFEYCSNLATITIPNSVTSIDEWAFRYCDSLTSITIPNSVTSIGDHAFRGCSMLASITIPDSITSIEGGTFWNCDSLTSITIPNSVESIGYNAFTDCSNLTSITIPDSVTSIENSAFSGCSNLANIIIPDSVKSIEGGAFSGCSNLTSINIPNSVTSIGEWTFSDCSNLTSITIPTSVTIIGDGAFSGCSNLTNITIPSSVKNIGDYAFYDCSNLSSITIPNSVTSIGDYTFEYCPNLTSITIPDSVTNIGDYAFYGCDSLTSIIVENNNDYYSSVDGVLFNKEMTELICFPAGKATSYAIPDSVTSIVDWAFGGCDGLTSITIPNSVTSIGEWTFSDCSNLTSITIPTSVTSIGIRAFSFCSSLTNITIPNSVTSIREGAFEFCSSLTSITIPNHVTSISDGAFYNCSGLTSITIPDSVTSIGNSAFKYCDNLTIYGYSGSYAETFANENDIPFVSLETSPSLLLNQLISVNYLAFADLAYSKTYKEGQTISSMLASKWDKYWDNTNITYKELYKNIADWTVDSFHSDSNTGFAAYVFKNSHNQYLISYRGSSKLTAKSFLSDPDWLPNDISMILGYEGEQVSQAISLYDTIAKKADVSNIAVTGHSLGGALADIVSAYSGCYGETFNSAPFLDIAYWYFPKEMSKTFAGIETWNFVDHVNKDDRKVGNWFAEEVKPKIVYKHVSHNNNSSHALSSLIKKNNSGIIMLSEPTSIRFKNSVTEQPSILSSFSVIFGTEKSDTITKFNIMGHDLALYGGDGSDKMYTDIFDDYLVGGKGSDTLDGNRGDDTYIYNKGDGVDTIYDINGHDKLYLYGFSNNDSIILDSESNNNFVLIKHNNNTIIKVNKSRGLGGGSFNVIVNDNSFNIVDHMKEKKFTKRYVIACPVDIEILDENKNVVYTVKDAETGAYYTDYGNFYIYEEENGEYGKTIDLIEGYSIRIVGIDDGTMDVSVQYEENGVISKPFATENVPVSLGMSANIVSNESQEFELSLDYDDDKNADSTIKLLNYSTVKFNSNKGNCNISSIKAYEGKLEELPEATREGYTFKGWYTSKYNGTKITSDTIFEEDTTIYAQWICGEKCVSSKFTDVDTKQWYHESIDYAVENGLMNGVSDTRFDINGTTTRSQLVTLLWRLEGQPEVDYEINFRDVESDSWYTEAIRWAASKSIVNGYSDTEFGTNDAITREQLAALLYRYEQYKGGGFKGQWDYTLNFADLKYMSDWAYEAMSWCNMKGLINGKGDNLLDPQGKAIRCEAAALLMRYIEMER